MLKSLTKAPKIQKWLPQICDSHFIKMNLRLTRYINHGLIEFSVLLQAHHVSSNIHFFCICYRF